MNTVSNIADMSNIAATPLTEKEMNMLTACFAGTLVDAEMKNDIKSFIKSITTSLHDIMIQQREKDDEIIRAINELTAAQRELTKIIIAIQSGNKSIYVTNLDDDERKEWIKTTKSKIEKIRKAYDVESRDVYNNIYNKMKYEFSHDVYTLFRSNNYKSIIDMCSHSDELMNAMDKCIEAIAPSNNIKSKKAAKTTAAIDKRITIKCPANVANAISMNGKAPKGRSFQKAHRILASYFDVDKMMSETKNKYGIDNCSIWFAISQYPDVVSKLERIYKNI